MEQKWTNEQRKERKKRTNFITGGKYDQSISQWNVLKTNP